LNKTWKGVDDNVIKKNYLKKLNRKEKTPMKKRDWIKENAWWLSLLLGVIGIVLTLIIGMFPATFLAMGVALKSLCFAILPFFLQYWSQMVLFGWLMRLHFIVKRKNKKDAERHPVDKAS
jgi:heme O synthase-like polyprenyltransferase